MAGRLERPRVLSALACVLLLLHLSRAWNDDLIHNLEEATCSRSCVAESCNTIGIRYGKFCGVGWTGCPGEKPCDDLDACCMAHDECVGKNGMANVKCHEKFQKCMKRVKKSGRVGFSKGCPYEVAIPTMSQGMEMAILLSKLGGIGALEQESYTS